ncbi:MAG: RCC1 repeat-containing protein [Chloroflexota bacterium]
MAKHRYRQFHLAGKIVILGALLAIALSNNASAAYRAEQTLLDTQTEPPLLQNIVQIGSGDSFTCGLNGNGCVNCWGSNANGRLGNTSEQDRSTPLQVVGLTDQVTNIAVGSAHACVLNTSGGVSCWGSNRFGQLGNGTQTDSPTPVQVAGLATGVVGISAGATRSCALMQTGEAKCWGSGRLGNNSETSSSIPVDVAHIDEDIVSISVGNKNTCLLTSSGKVKCWGINNYGQIGDGTFMNRNEPVDVAADEDEFKAVAAGELHTCALTTIGDVKCWGASFHGELGASTPISSPLPIQINGLPSNLIDISTMGRTDLVSFGEPVYTSHTCVLTDEQSVWCWGVNRNGQLGDGTTTSSSTPRLVESLSGTLTNISAGVEHTCAVTDEQTVMCWGANGYGQLGNSEQSARYTPVNVEGLDQGVASISAGSDHICSLTDSNAIQCWGRNDYGQLGDGTTSNRSTPVDVVDAPDNITAVSTGGSFGNGRTCLVTDASTVLCWGNEYDGLTEISGLIDDIHTIEVGWNHTCVLNLSGTVNCWGSNYAGQLGDGTNLSGTTPTTVKDLPVGIRSISAGGEHTCALSAEGSVLCWGSNEYGQLGNGQKTNSNVPVDVEGLGSGIIAVAAGSEHTCAVTEAGTVKCWGHNHDGALGDGTNVDSAIPVDVQGLASAVTAIAVDRSWISSFTCTLTAEGRVLCWGSNTVGQLGLPMAIVSTNLPTEAVPLDESVTALSSGNLHVCVLTSSSDVMCWGYNVKGQLGVNPGWIPVNVVSLSFIPIHSTFIPMFNQPNSR